MSMNEQLEIAHLVVTPCRNDHQFLLRLFNSMINQTVLPREWIIVLDNPTNSDFSSVSSLIDPFDWIKIKKVSDFSSRKRGAKIAKLSNLGISESEYDWSFISKIDADMQLPEDYFAMIFHKFSERPELGIASGTCYVLDRTKKIIENVSSNHTRGGLKTYSKQCFEKIGGIREVDGWDGVDNILAQYNGFETANFADIEVFHGRRTGSHFGLIRGNFESGMFAFSLRYFPLFMLARVLHQLSKKPVFFGGISMFMGYVFAALTRKEYSISVVEGKFFRKVQKQRMKFWRRF